MTRTSIAELTGQIEHGIICLERLAAGVNAALDNEVRILGRTSNSALIIAGLIESYYTCLETVLLRISQTFENNLSAERWHADLLEKMTHEVTGVRAAVISGAVYPQLMEILKFRHFRRYYYQIEHDWDKIDFVLKKVTSAHPAVIQDLGGFISFLRQV
jgi:hypothetical protein